MINQPYSSYPQHQGMRMTTKELNYLSDTMKNEDLLAKLCVQGAVECQNSQLKSVLEQMAEAHMHSYQHLLSTMQQHG